MRERRGISNLGVVGLTLAWLLLLPLAAAAASGLPATITMNPGTAGPGSTVEVVGVDFPAGQEVDIRLTTTAGAFVLGAATAADEGYFRQAVTFPADLTPGFWELRATSRDGVMAAHIFEAGSGTAAAAAGAGAAATAQAAAAGSSGFGTDALVLLVIAVLIASVGGAAAFVWYQLNRGDAQPGMSTGEDPIWGGAGGESSSLS